MGSRVGRGRGDGSLGLSEPLLTRSTTDRGVASSPLHASRAPPHVTVGAHSHVTTSQHSLPLGTAPRDVRAVARRGFRPLRGAWLVLLTWAGTCVATLWALLTDERGLIGPFDDAHAARASLNAALLLASGALELTLRHVLKRRQRQGYLAFYRGVRKLIPQPFRIVALGTAVLFVIVTTGWSVEAGEGGGDAAVRGNGGVPPGDRGANQAAQRGGSIAGRPGRVGSGLRGRGRSFKRSRDGSRSRGGRRRGRFRRRRGVGERGAGRVQQVPVRTGSGAREGVRAAAAQAGGGKGGRREGRFGRRRRRFSTATTPGDDSNDRSARRGVVKGAPPSRARPPRRRCGRAPELARLRAELDERGAEIARLHAANRQHESEQARLRASTTSGRRTRRRLERRLERAERGSAGGGRPGGRDEGHRNVS